MIEQKDCTIIIPHLGQSPESKYAIRKCLSSLIGGDTTDPWESKIIVVTNGSEEIPVLPILSDKLTQVHVKEQGQCKAVNAAVATVDTPWVLVTNDDMVYPPGWWNKLTDFHNQEVACISPKLVEPRPGAPTFLTEFCGGAGGDFDKDKFFNFVKQYEQDLGGNRVIIGPGFNLPFLIKKELWDVVGGYDVNYDPWGSNSDSDLEYKIKLAGVQSWQHQEALVYHFSQTSGTFEPRNQEYWNKNWQYFIDKWGFPRTDDGIWQANFKIPNEGRIFRPDWEGKYGH